MTSLAFLSVLSGLRTLAAPNPDSAEAVPDMHDFEGDWMYALDVLFRHQSCLH